MPRRMTASVSNVILTMASWGACFWLGFQVGTGRSALRYKADVVELERRFKVVDCKVVDPPSSESVEARS